MWGAEGRRKGLVHRQIRGLKPLEALATSGGTVLAANLSQSIVRSIPSATRCAAIFCKSNSKVYSKTLKFSYSNIKSLFFKNILKRLPWSWASYSQGAFTSAPWTGLLPSSTEIPVKEDSEG